MRWACPLCGSRHYMRVVLSRGKEAFDSQFFTCFGCSIVFIEPQLCSDAGKVIELYPAVESEMAHLMSNERLSIERRFWAARGKRLKGGLDVSDAVIRELWLRGRLE